MMHNTNRSTISLLVGLGGILATVGIIEDGTFKMILLFIALIISFVLLSHGLRKA